MLITQYTQTCYAVKIFHSPSSLPIFYKKKTSQTENCELSCLWQVLNQPLHWVHPLHHKRLEFTKTKEFLAFHHNFHPSKSSLIRKADLYQKPQSDRNPQLTPLVFFPTEPSNGAMKTELETSEARHITDQGIHRHSASPRLPSPHISTHRTHTCLGDLCVCGGGGTEKPRRCTQSS